MKRLTIGFLVIGTTLLLTVVVCTKDRSDSLEVLDTRFDQLIPGCYDYQRDSAEPFSSVRRIEGMRRISQGTETAIASDGTPYSRHERTCSSSRIVYEIYGDKKRKIRVTFGVLAFASANTAQNHLDNMIAEMKEDGGVWVPPMGPIIHIHEPSWVKTAKTRYQSNDRSWLDTTLDRSGAETLEFFFRTDRFIGRLTTSGKDIRLISHSDISTVFANRLISSLHNTVSASGEPPHLSSIQAIKRVKDYIRARNPINYIQLVPDYEKPEPEAPIKDFDKTWMQQFIDRSEEARQEWKNAGSPMVEYRWSEDKECAEWDYQLPGSERPVPMLDFFPWYAEFQDAEDVERLRKYRYQLPNSPGNDDEDTKLGRATSEPYWLVNGLSHQDHGCSWILNETEGVIHVMSSNWDY